MSSSMGTAINMYRLAERRNLCAFLLFQEGAWTLPTVIPGPVITSVRTSVIVRLDSTEPKANRIASIVRHLIYFIPMRKIKQNVMFLRVIACVHVCTCVRAWMHSCVHFPIYSWFRIITIDYYCYNYYLISIRRLIIITVSYLRIIDPPVNWITIQYLIVSQ